MQSLQWKPSRFPFSQIFQYTWDSARNNQQIYSKMASNPYRTVPSKLDQSMKSDSTSQNSSSICASMVNSWFFRIWHSPSSSWANLSVVCKRTFDLGVKWNDLKKSWKKLPLLPNAGIMDFLFPIRYFLSKHIPSISAIWHSCEVEVSIDLRRELLNDVTKSDLANCGTGDSESKHRDLWRKNIT